MINNQLTVSIWVNRKFKTSEFLFLARENFPAKKRLATSWQLSPVSLDVILLFGSLSGKFFACYLTNVKILDKKWT